MQSRYPSVAESWGTEEVRKNALYLLYLYAQQLGLSIKAIVCCFFCTECQTPLVPLGSGDPNALQSDKYKVSNLYYSQFFIANTLQNLLPQPQDT